MNSQVNIKIEPKLKKEVDLISSDIGLNTSDVVRIFLKKFVSSRGFPFPLVSNYNEETEKVMKDVKNGQNLIQVKGGLKNLKNTLK